MAVYSKDHLACIRCKKVTIIRAKSFQLYMFLQSRLDAEWGVFEYVVYTEGVFEYMAY